MFRINWSDPPRSDILRIAEEKISGAQDALRRQPDGLDAAVHSSRKAIKHCRSLLRLIRSADAEGAKHLNTLLRAISTELSSLRDQAALQEAAAHLAAVIPGPAADRLAESFKARPTNLSADPSDITALAAVRLSDASRTLGDLDLPDGRGKLSLHMARGWRRTGKRAATALERCMAESREEDFHDLRKRGQDRWMQASLLRKIWPSGLIAIQASAKQMVDMLGQARDFGRLQAEVAQLPDFDDRDRITLTAAMESERMRLHREALTLAHDLFHHDSKKEADIIRLLIRNA
ncbi:CHAD domain-containing protein [Rhizobium sp. SG_E_25_P2]|uniref:CHAD domain-containing protein n=1 Tax=Rhizobium sp. SG_E_25_P2 TaxID=2879942 RepID=UPI002474029F|nr:CHAD domain-containing protein [Rhizobium sp. SG_E_25_P2]MDH6267022.1 CHAD domain-containing protein [Rhizobium sp. SG_E_25_P2]